MATQNPYPPDFYSTFEEAKTEIGRRWQDVDLRREVSAFLGDSLFPHMAERPRAVLSRDIVSPDIECGHFLKKSKEMGLDPLFLEYTDDKFVAKNPDKYHLCSLYFLDTRAKRGQEISKLKIVDFNIWEGKKFSEIKTKNGNPFVDVHHKLFSDMYPDMVENVIEFSNWFNSTRYSSEFYYLHFLSLFVCHGVLFENFLTDDKEELAFTLEKVIPSFEEIKKKFGVKPLIVPMAPTKEESDIYWWCFPQELKEKVLLYDKPQ